MRQPISLVASIVLAALVAVCATVAAADVHYVEVGGQGTGTGWGQAYARGTIAQAITDATSGDEIWVKAGIYTERITLKAGVGLYGGFSGTEQPPRTARAAHPPFNQDQWTNDTIIDGSAGGYVVTVPSGATSTTIIDGFTIRNGTTGVYCSGASATSATITHNRIEFNSSNGVYASNGAPQIKYNVIQRNGGGGVSCGTYASATVWHNIIRGNSSHGVYCTTNVSIGGNFISGNRGSGVATTGTTTIYQNTVAGNAGSSGAIANTSGSALISGNIVAFNASGMYHSGSGTPNVANNCVYSNAAFNYSGITQPGSDIDDDPLLGSVEFGELHIQPDSPCVGQVYRLLFIDIDGEQGPIASWYNIGADAVLPATPPVYSGEPPCVVFVDGANGQDSNNGQSWQTAKATIQASIDAAAEWCGEVWVAAGTYNECISLRPHVNVYGGFDNEDLEFADRDWRTNTTTIDGSGYVIEDYPAVHVNTGHLVSRLDGFRVTNGWREMGAGFLCQYASAYITNNTIEGNGGWSDIGGDCLLGGGIYCQDSYSVIANNVIRGNSAMDFGSAIGCWNSQATIANNEIVNNTCGEGTAAAVHVVVDPSSSLCPTLVSNTIADNTGTGISIWASTGHGAVGNYFNNIIAGNTEYGVFYYNGLSPYPVLGCNNVYGSGTADYYGVSAGTGDISSAPTFLDSPNGNYRLAANSPCIDAGSNPAPCLPSLDLDGWPRVLPANGTVDMGAYECDASAPSTPSVTDEGPSTQSTSQLQATWASEDAETGVAEYQYAIGTAQYPATGYDTVATWTSQGANTGVIASDLTLTNGQTYYFAVKAMNGQGGWSTVGVSDGITVNTDGEEIHISLVASADSIYLCDSITVTATASDTDIAGGVAVSDTVTSFSWYLNGELASEGQGTNTSTLQFCPTLAGPVRITVVANDHPYYTDDAAVSAEVVVGVEDPANPPISASAVSGLSASGPWAGEILDIGLGTTIYFKGDWAEAPSSDQDMTSGCTLDADTIASYTWDFGDNSGDTGAAVSHVYASASQYMSLYTVGLTCEDDATISDDPTSDPSQLTVRVFETVPPAPVVVVPGIEELHNGLSPTFRWEGQTHDKYQVRVQLGNDPNITPAVWDSGEISGQESECVCAVDLVEYQYYYVFVREHNVLGWGAWSPNGHYFCCKVPEEPENYSVSWDPAGPDFTCGDRVTCVATYLEWSQGSNIDTGDLLIDESTLDGISACHVRYSPVTDQCWLADNDGLFTIGGDGFTPGSTNVMENDQVKVYLEDTSVYMEPGVCILEVAWSLEFKKPFAGPKDVALSVVNNAGLYDPDNPEVMDSIEVQANGINSRFTSPANGAYIPSSTVNIAGEAWDTVTDHIESVEVSTDGGETWTAATVQPGQGTRSWSYSFQDMEDGTYTLKSRATNDNEDVEDPVGSGIRVAVDTVAPTSAIVSPLNGASITGPWVNISGNCFDANGKVVKVELRFDAGAWVEAELGSSGLGFTYTYNIPPSADNTPLTIQCRATDAAGHVEIPSAAIAVTITYDDVAPAADPSGGVLNVNTSQFAAQKTLAVGQYSVMNLASGMITTSIPLTSWKSSGPLSVGFSLYHQQFRPDCPTVVKELWMHSYQSILTDSGANGVSIYHPDGSGQYWWKWTGSQPHYYLGAVDNWDELVSNGTAGFTVTLQNHTQMVYGHSIGNNQWMLSEIKSLRNEKVTLEYDPAKPALLKWIRDPDGKRYLYLAWTTVNGHDALSGVYTSWGFGSKYTQLYWLRYTNNNLTSIDFPKDMTAYGQGVDAPYLPDGVTSLKTATQLRDRFLQLQFRLNFTYQAYSYENRITQVAAADRVLYSLAYNGLVIATGGSRYCSMEDTHYFMQGSVKATMGSAVTTVALSAESPYEYTNYPNGIRHGNIVTAVVKAPSGGTTTYRHVHPHSKTWADKNGYLQWSGLRIADVTATATIGGKSVTRRESYQWYPRFYYDNPDWHQNGRLKWRVDPKGVTSAYTWSAGCMLSSKNLSTNEQATMTYEQRDLLTTTDPAGLLTANTYDPTYRELTKTQIDPNNLNISTDYAYDSKGNLSTTTGPYYGQASASTPVTSYEYCSGFSGLPSKVTVSGDTTDRFVQTRYTGLGVRYWESQPRRVGHADKEAPTIWLYDKAGRPFYVWSSGDLDSTTDYDGYGRVGSTTNADGCEASFSYLDCGLPSGGASWNKTFDGFLASHQNYDSAMRPTYSYVWDQTGNPSMRFGAICSYNQFSELSGITARQTPDLSPVPTQLFEYDANGNPSKATNARGGTATKTYDNANRLTQVAYAGGVTHYFTYYTTAANKGRPWQVKEGSTVICSYDFYDTAGRLTDETRNNVSRKIHYEYDAAGRRTQLQIRDMSSDPLTTYNYEYYKDGQLKKMEFIAGTDAARTTTYEYNDPRGRLTKVTYPNGTWAEYTYQTTGWTGKAESRSLLQKVHHKGGNTPFYRQYTYDKLGHVKTVTNGTFTTTYTYDDFGRLTNEQRTGGDSYNYSYTYDAIGNRLTRVNGSTTTVYSNDDDNKLMSTTGPTGSYSYDRDGNLTSKTVGGITTSYTYDINNNLKTTALPGSQFNCYYDALGYRYKTAVVGSAYRLYLYIDGTLYEELKESYGTRVSEVRYNPGIMEIRYSSPTNYAAIYYQHDGLGSMVTTTNPSGQKRADTMVMGAYGDPINVSVASGTRYRYHAADGYYTDTNSGLLKLGARYYDPTIGRFITKDPARDGLNWYAYCGNDPVNGSDPTGLQIMTGTTGMSYDQMMGLAEGYAHLGQILFPPPSPDYEPGSWGSFMTFAQAMIPLVRAESVLCSTMGAWEASLASRAPVASLEVKAAAAIAPRVEPVVLDAITGSGGNGWVYELQLSNGASYIGRTTDYAGRMSYWAGYYGDDILRTRILGQHLNYNEMRGLEQFYIRDYGLDCLMNKINGVSLLNANYDSYMQSAWNLLIGR